MGSPPPGDAPGAGEFVIESGKERGSNRSLGWCAVAKCPKLWFDLFPSAITSLEVSRRRCLLEMDQTEPSERAAKVYIPCLGARPDCSCSRVPSATKERASVAREPETRKSTAASGLVAAFA